MQCTKKTLKAILAHRTVFKEVLRAALVEAEGILNSRPVTHVSNDAGDIEALTPNHCSGRIRVMRMLKLVIVRSTRQRCGDGPKR